MIHHLQFYGEEDDVAASLNFLVSALQAFVRVTRNAFTYLIQLLDDIDSSGVIDSDQLTEARAEALEHQNSAVQHPEKLTRPMTRFMPDTAASTAVLHGHSTISHAIAHSGFQSLPSPRQSPSAVEDAQDRSGRSRDPTLQDYTWQDTNLDPLSFPNFTTDNCVLFPEETIDFSTDAAMGSWSFPSVGQLPLDWDFPAPHFDNPSTENQVP